MMDSDEYRAYMKQLADNQAYWRELAEQEARLLKHRQHKPRPADLELNLQRYWREVFKHDSRYDWTE